MRNAAVLANAKALRREMTAAEARLWYQLRAGRFAGAKFRRQTPIGSFVADFTCRAAMLVIEVDGDTHAHSVEADARRTACLEERGWRVMRFANADIVENIEGVLHAIGAALCPSP